MRFRADSNSWNVNGTSNLRIVRQNLRALSESAYFDNFFAQPSALFQLGCQEPNFNHQIFYFQVYDNMVEENMYQELENMQGEGLSHKSFFWQI